MRSPPWHLGFASVPQEVTVSVNSSAPSLKTLGVYFDPVTSILDRSTYGRVISLSFLFCPSYLATLGETDSYSFHHLTICMWLSHFGISNLVKNSFTEMLAAIYCWNIPFASTNPKAHFICHCAEKWQILRPIPGLSSVEKTLPKSSTTDWNHNSPITPPCTYSSNCSTSIAQKRSSAQTLGAPSSPWSKFGEHDPPLENGEHDTPTLGEWRWRWTSPPVKNGDASLPAVSNH